MKPIQENEENETIAISVRDLRRDFRVKRKPAGLRGSVGALLHPEWKTVHAVQGVCFRMEQGETVGLIGPNGAGKSTIIKILTGILYPTSGHARVLGLVPWEHRRELAYHIGTVFGQRPQLWYHLPAIDTFHLFGKVYELNDETIRKRISTVVEAFEIADLMETPVRKLSLGQRMQCEVAASLLHGPRLILLDEPSIGLDITARQRIRDAICRMNERENVSVLLTSHDVGDIEALCRRVVIIHQGVVVYEDTISELKRRYLTFKLVNARYSDCVAEEFCVEGTEVIGIDRYAVKLRFDPRQVAVEAVLSRLVNNGRLVDITISDPSLEDVIRRIYQSMEELSEAAGASAET